MKKKDKTCGECKYRYAYHHDEDCNGRCKLAPTSRIPSEKPVCSDFDPIPPRTNGDKIRQGGNRALVQFKSEHKCDTCAYAAPLDHAPACLCPEGKSCFDGMLAWLNSPVEREVKDEQ